MKVKVSMSIWDNTLNDNERQDILLYCEHILQKACRGNYGKMTVVERWWSGETFIVETAWENMNCLLNSYNRRLNHLKYWRIDEPKARLVWENEYL